MLPGLGYLRELNMVSILVRLLCAMAFGGAVGIERGHKRRPAGFRTYMLVCLGAALTMLLSQYVVYMQSGPWVEQISELGLKNDVSRFGAQVINGIGFLGAGTILVTGHQEVKGRRPGFGPAPARALPSVRAFMRARRSAFCWCGHASMCSPCL